jgi:hypothetical protein
MDTYTAIGVLLLGVVIAVLPFSKFEMFFKNESSDEPKDKEVPPKKSIRLYSGSGEMLFEYKDVYISHWDSGIYYLSRKYERKSFLRIDKGRYMLLFEKRYEEGEHE